MPDLVAEAAARAGTAADTDRRVLANLERLVESCAETGALTAGGWGVLHRVVRRHLLNRLFVRGWLESRPEHGEVPLGPPLVITGLPRTGTTLLHNLLALDPRRRVLRLWEALHPVPTEPDGRFSEEALVAQAERWLEGLYELAPAFRTIHPASARGPEECDTLLQNTFASQHFDDMFDARAYSEWFAAARLDEEYAYYALQLRALTRPGQAGVSWVLKSPGHLGHLDEMLATFPSATVVHCHRDPLAAVPSYASLVLTVRSPHAERVAPAEIGRQALARATNALDRALQTRRATGTNGFVDVAYTALVADPVATTTEIYERLGWDLDAELQERMRRWAAANPRHQLGAHHYDLGRFGLDAEQVREAFGAYTAEFAGLVAQ